MRSPDDAEVILANRGLQRPLKLIYLITAPSPPEQIPEKGLEMGVYWWFWRQMTKLEEERMVGEGKQLTGGGISRERIGALINLLFFYLKRLWGFEHHLRNLNPQHFGVVSLRVLK